MGASQSGHTSGSHSRRPSNAQRRPSTTTTASTTAPSDAVAAPATSSSIAAAQANAAGTTVTQLPQSSASSSVNTTASSVDTTAASTPPQNRRTLSVALEFASAAPHSEGASASSIPSAATFASLHSTTAASTTSQDRFFLTPKTAGRTIPPQPMSPESLTHVSDAIRNELGLDWRGYKTPPATPGQSLIPSTPSLLTNDASEQKLILLLSLFQAIDQHSDGYLQRQALLNWCEHEPWLRQDSLLLESRKMLERVTHDEDSRVSKNEFTSAFDGFTSGDVITLIINLLRAGMISRIPRTCFVYNSHDFYLNGSIEASPELSPEPGAHSVFSVHDTPANTLLASSAAHHQYGTTPGALSSSSSFASTSSSSASTHQTESQKHFFLIDVLFHSFDRDLDSQLDTRDLQRWLRADSWIHEGGNEPLFEAVDTCWTELLARNQALGFIQPPEEPLDAKSHTAAEKHPIGPARLDKHFFFLAMSQVPKKLIRKLLVHLLSRNASSVMEDAETARTQAKSFAAAATPPAVTLISLQAPSSTLALPSLPYPLVRTHSVVIGGEKRLSVPDGLRLTLVGQSMIQHDIRTSNLGARMIREMKPLLKADVVFTELETSLVRPGREPEKKRSTVFFHAAGPEVVDCLSECGFNLFATANNHSGDLGEEGIETIMDEFRERQLAMAGIGRNAMLAARACFLDTPNGRIGQVAFASKIPEHSIARENQPGVNSLSMIDVDSSKLNPQELNRVLGAIEDARAGFRDEATNTWVEKADLLIAYHHNHYWERLASSNSSASAVAAVNQEAPMGQWKRELAHRIIDAGAHVYVAHGDPRLQGIEIYRGSPIFYCLGNFIFQTKTPVQFYGGEVWQSVIVHLHCNDVAEATSYSVKLIPVVLNEVGETEETHLQTRGLPRLASRVDGQQILQKLQQLSAPFGTTITIESAAEDADSPVIGWVLGAQVPKGTPIDDGILAKAIFSLDVAAPAPKLPLSAAAKTAPDTSSLQLQVPEIPFASRELSPQAATFSHDETMTPF